MDAALPGWQRDLFDRRSMGVRLGLEVIQAGFERLGRPAGLLPAVHIVGTNGKGSTAAMTAHGLVRAGRRVGLYTSPHLHRVGERVRIDGEPLADEALREHVVAALAIEAELPRQLTFFELLTLAAMRAFAAAEVDVLVLEAGLGGRLDATRIGRAVVTVVTSIGLDHTALLGPNIAAIAREKAAVFAAGAPAFSAIQPDAAVVEICAAAARAGVPVTFVPPLARAPLGLPGEHQRQNAALALAALRHFVPDATPGIFDDARWPGRLERRAHGAGAVVFDVAHNVDGIRALARHLRSAPGSGPRIILFGCMADKEGPAMAALLAELDAELWLASPGDHDGWAPARLGAAAAEARIWGADAWSSGAIQAAVEAALARGAEVVACGSHYLVGALRAALFEEVRDPLALTDPLPRG